MLGLEEDYQDLWVSLAAAKGRVMFRSREWRGGKFCWGQILWAALESLVLSSNGKVKYWDTENIQAKAIELLSRNHLALLMELHPLVWMKTVNSTHSPQVSLRQRGSTSPKDKLFLFLMSFYLISVFPSSFKIRLHLIGTYSWLSPRVVIFSSVSRELLTYLVSGSVLDISVVWNCSSRSKNGVCAIVNLMTEWRNIDSFVGDTFFF